MTPDEARICLSPPRLNLSQEEKARRNAIYSDLILKSNAPRSRRYLELESFLVGQAMSHGVKIENSMGGHSQFYEYYVDDEGYNRLLHKGRPNPKRHQGSIFKLILESVADDMLDDPVYQDLAFEIFADGYLSYFTASRYKPRQEARSHLTKLDGSLREPSEYKAWLKSKQRIRFLAASATHNNDMAGLAEFFSLQQVKEAIPDIARFFTEIGLKPGSMPWKLAHPTTKNGTPFSNYARDLALLVDLNKEQGVDQIYKSEYSVNHGHLIAYKVRNCNTSASEKLCEKLSRDGADWYMAYRMIVDGPEVEVDLKDRLKDSTSELLEILSNELSSEMQRPPHYLRGLLRGISSETTISLVRYPAAFDLLHKITNDPALMPHLSTEGKRRGISEGLGM